MDEEQQAKPKDPPWLARIAIYALIGLLMWVIFGRIGGHPFPH